MSKIRMDVLTSVKAMAGDDEEDTRLLRELHSRAVNYLTGFTWCRSIREAYFGVGIGGVVAVFLFRIDPAPRVDEWLWVVVGDLPSAFMVTDNAPDPVAALEGYCELMSDWVDAVRKRGNLQQVFPVDAPATEEFASMLESRVSTLRTEIIPELK